MAKIVWADVTAMAPELTTLTDTTREDVLAYANELDSTSIGGGENGATLRLARILLAAHLGLLTKRARTGAAGPVTSEAVGGLRRSYGLMALAAGDEGFGSTIYGQQYLMLVSTSLAHGPFLV